MRSLKTSKLVFISTLIFSIAGAVGCDKTAENTNKPVIINNFKFTLDGDAATSAGTLQMEPGSVLTIVVEYIDPDAGSDANKNIYSFTWIVERIGSGASTFNPNENFIVMDENPCIWTAPDVTGFYRFRVEVRDRYQTPSQESVVVEVNSNKQPVINSIIIKDVPPAPFVNQVVEFIVEASDPDGNLPLEFTWQASGGYFIEEIDGHAKWLSPVPGAFSITVIVEDQAGGTVSRIIPLVVQDNHAPVIAGWVLEPDGSIAINQSVTITLSVTDADDDELEYNWTSDSGGFTSVNRNVAVWKPPGVAVTALISIVVEDNKGGSDSAEIVIVVN